MATVVGTAYVRLRLLTDQVGKDIAKSIENSDLKDLKLNVQADTQDADKKLDNTGKKAKEAERQFGLLGTAIAALAPTIGPLAGAATALGAGFVAGAGVAILAIHGVKEEMKDGTKVGQVYSAGLQKLDGMFDSLGRTAAKGLLGGFDRTVSELQKDLPGVNQAVGRLSVVLGDLGSHVVVGLVGGLEKFEPLMMHVVVLADQAAAHFEKWATGPGGAKFGATLSADLDQVVPVLTNLALAVERLVVAAGPLGSTVLSSIGLLSKLLLALPMPVLQALILGIVTLKTALTGLAIVDKISTAFDKFGKAAEKAGVTSTVGKFGALGVAGGLAGAALFGLSTIMDENAKHAQYVAKVTQDYVTALEDTKGAVDNTITALTLQNAVQDGTAATLTKAGISTQQWVDAIQNGGPALTSLADKLLKSTGPAHLLYSNLVDQRDAFVHAQAETKTYTDALDAANVALAKSNPQLAAQAQALGITATAYQDAQKQLEKKTETDAKNYALQQLEIAQNYQLAGTQDQLAKAYGITTAQVQSYAAMLGITQTQVQNGQVSYLKYEDAVRRIHDAYDTATASGSTFLAALQTFSQSAGTAADRAQLLGAYLKALQGDLLSYQGAVAAAYTANDQLVKSFDAAQKNSINLKTGLIDVTKAGAGPLIQSLQQMQDAAMAAASATYQHEVATKGAGKAASDAAKVFKGETYDALVTDAKQLGITSGEAKKLADHYFALPKDVETKVKAIGTDPVINVLNKIGQQLSFLTGHAWNPKVGLIDAATAAINSIRNKLASLNGQTSTVTIREEGVLSKQAAQIQAHGLASGGGMPEGWSTVGEGNPNTWELVHKAGSQVQVYSNSQAKAMAPGLGPVPGFQIGTTSHGGKQYFTYGGKLYSSYASAYNAEVAAQASRSKASTSAAARLQNQALTLRIRIDDKDLYSLSRVIGGSVAQVAGQMHTLILDLQKAAALIPGRQGQYGILLQIERDNTKLQALVHTRNSLTNQLKVANTRLASLRQGAAQETASVASAVAGGFNVTTAGAFQVGGNQYQTAAGILVNLQQQVRLAKTFEANLAKAKRGGLDTHLLRQIGESGYQTGGSAAAALAGASPAQIAAINRQFGQLVGAGTAAGNIVSSAVFGQQIKATQQLIRTLSAERNATVRQIQRLTNEIERLARALANRPVQLVANGRELARLVNNQNAANARR